MKKLVVILFSLVLAVSIVACGHESIDQEELETKAYGWAELETPTEEISNADLQKFMLDESDKELLDYKVDIESEGDYVFHVRINPDEVHKEQWTKISFIANVKFSEELNQSEGDYIWQYSLADIYV